MLFHFFGITFLTVVVAEDNGGGRRLQQGPEQKNKDSKSENNQRGDRCHSTKGVSLDHRDNVSLQFSLISRV